MNAFRLQELLAVHDKWAEATDKHPDDMGASMWLTYAEEHLAKEVVGIARFALTRDADANRLMDACVKQNHEIEQTLGTALGFPYYADDQITFPGATRESGVCVGDHVAESLALTAAAEIGKLQARLSENLWVIEHRESSAETVVIGLAHLDDLQGWLSEEIALHAYPTGYFAAYHMNVGGHDLIETHLCFFDLQLNPLSEQPDILSEADS